MGSAKGVVHVDVAVGGKLLGHLLLLGLHIRLLRGVLLVAHVVGLLDLAFLGLVETGVLKHQDLARLKGGSLRVGILAVLGKLDGNPKILRQVVANRPEAEVRLVTLPLRTTKMAHQNEGGTLLKNILDCGLGGLDASVVGNLMLGIQRNVEVNAHDYLLALQIHVADRFLVH